MTRRIYTLLYILCLATAMVCAQPGAVKKNTKSMLKITTFKADGTLLSSGYGIFVGSDGTAIASWMPFVGASSAIAIDGQGKKYDVDCLFGASEIYNVTKLRVKTDAKSKIIPAVIEDGRQDTGTDIWLATYDVKSPSFTRFKTTNVETFMGDLPYYIVEQQEAKFLDEHAGLPFFNAQGQLMGLLKTSKTRTDLHVASARYAMTLAPSALSMNDNILRNTNVRIALPTEYNLAVLSLLVASQRNDSINYPATIEEFITLFPDKEDGYINKAEWLLGKHEFSQSAQCMETAISKSDRKDNVHFIYSKLIYNKETLMNGFPYDAWSLDKAMQEIDTAYSINPLPLYRIHRGKIFFAQQKYNDALAEFNYVNTTDMKDADVYFFAYQCLRLLDADPAQQMEQLDSCLSLQPKELLYQAEKTLLLLRTKKYAEALELSRSMVASAPYYAEGHGLLGLSLCLSGNKQIGIVELKRAKAMGYTLADSFLQKYGNEQQQE